MKKIILSIQLVFLVIVVEGQIITDVKVLEFLSKYPKVDIVPVVRDTSYWKSKGKSELLFSENYYKNWNAGGDNIVTSLLKVDWKAVYNKNNLNWENVLKVEYGLNKQEDQGVRKVNDLLEFTSTVGYNVYRKWFASAQMKFNTQFTKGYDYVDDGDNILKTSIFSPAKIFIGAGARYIRDENFYIYISPFTENTSIVVDRELASTGDINRNKERVYTKLGPWIDLVWKYNFYDDYVLLNKVSLYSDYVHSFGSVDYFDWQLDLSLPLHKHLTVSSGLNVRYEKDILFDVENSETNEKETRIQFRQILGLGFKYDF